MFKQEEVMRAFSECGLRMTSQRFFVMEYLRCHVHATADDIFRAINQSDPRASWATVYNSLNVLSHAGLVREISSTETRLCLTPTCTAIITSFVTIAAW